MNKLSEDFIKRMKDLIQKEFSDPDYPYTGITKVILAPSTGLPHMGTVCTIFMDYDDTVPCRVNKDDLFELIDTIKITIPELNNSCTKFTIVIKDLQNYPHYIANDGTNLDKFVEEEGIIIWEDLT